MFNYDPLYAILEQSPMQHWVDDLRTQIDNIFANPRHHKFPAWQIALQQLPNIEPNIIDLNTGALQIESEPPCSAEIQRQINDQLQAFKPWRKGPFNIHGIHIDTEWRSDLKWDRLQAHIEPLAGRNVLDIGCGSGYHCWRMAAEGAKLALGIEPSLLYVCQYWLVRHFLGQSNTNYPAFVAPLGIDDLPTALSFDTVFSMGILYHRRSAIDHLMHLKKLLKKGGELVLETLVIEGDENTVLVPKDRYAQMRNVWFIPSCKALEIWLQRCGFDHITIADVTPTLPEEQRKTKWIDSHSLEHFLDPNDPSKTIEGYPAPLRALITAKRA